MTDRTLSTSEDVSSLDFAKGGGMVTTIAQDADTGAVLMTAFATPEALDATLDTGELHFWSRSRSSLWKKGETSGNVLRVVSLHADCDSDAVLALVRPTGPACHTGERSCFGEGAAPAAGGDAEGSLGRLSRTIEERAQTLPLGSYTTRLLEDRNLRLKKIGEETAELVTALADADGPRATEEAADVFYHLLVALRATGVGLEELERELDARAG